jgi:hypothetical protein
MKTVTKTHNYTITMEFKDPHAKLVFEQNNSYSEPEIINIHSEDLLIDDHFFKNEVHESKAELESLLRYLCYHKDIYDYSAKVKHIIDEEGRFKVVTLENKEIDTLRLEQAINYTETFSLFGVETYNGWDWDSMHYDFELNEYQPFPCIDLKNSTPAEDILIYCIAKVLITLNHKF